MRVRAATLGCALLLARPALASARAVSRVDATVERAGADRDWLRSARVAGSVDNASHGKNDSTVVLLRGAEGLTRKALFKPRAGEHLVFGDVAPGTYYRREVAASDLASVLGLSFVPPTVVRTVDGRKGSAMEWVDGAIRADTAGSDWKIDRLEGERLRVFDYLIGNGDRHAKNLLMTRDAAETVHPVAIDHGLAFPLGVMFRWNLPARVFGEAAGPLLPETLAFVAGIDPSAVAAVLARNGVEPFAAAFTLRRLARLQADPSFLQLERNDQVAGVGAEPEQGLSRAQLAHIDRQIEAAYRR